ncbi:hypothetical protein BH10PLA1_BH10PLA1_04160 [soil metagenome]
MRSRWIGGLFALVAMTMMIAALWLWQYAPAAAMQYRVAERSVFAMAGRCAAVALIAAAQWLIISSVVGAVYRTSRLDRAFCRVAGLVCGVAMISAVALGLASR